jgi:hypothetical protein
MPPYITDGIDHAVWRAFNNSGSVVMVGQAIHRIVTDNAGCQLWANPGQNTPEGLRPRPQVDYRHQSLGFCSRRWLHSG